VTSAYTFAYTLPTGYAYALTYVQVVHLVFKNKGVGVQLVYENTCCLAWGVISDRREIGVLSVCSLFLT